MATTTKKTNGFGEMPQFDPMKWMGEFDPSKWVGEFQKNMTEFNKAFGDAKMPGVDFGPLVEAQRKNIEAMTAANRVAVEGLQAVYRRQSEILRETMDEMQNAIQDVSQAPSVQDSVAKQADLVKGSMEKALANLRELTEMVSKSNTEAFDAVHKRFAENLDEVREQVLKLKH